METTHFADHADLLGEIAQLRRRISDLEEKQDLQKPWHFRKLVVGCLLLAAAAIAGAAVLQLPGDNGRALVQFMDFTTPPVVPPPLGTEVRWQRRDPVGSQLGGTNQILSLIADANQKNSYTWPLYIQLSATSDPNADSATSQSVGATVRAFNRSTGTPAVIGFHSEMYHGMSALPAMGGHDVDSRGTSILLNGELTNRSAHGETVGLNLQNTPASTFPGSHAINIQSTATNAIWENGVHFESPPGVIAGNIGINFDAAHYNMGIDLANNSLRLNAGQKIILEKFGSVYLWYNAATAHVELVKGGHVVAAW